MEKLGDLLRRVLVVIKRRERPSRRDRGGKTQKTKKRQGVIAHCISLSGEIGGSIHEGGMGGVRNGRSYRKILSTRLLKREGERDKDHNYSEKWRAKANYLQGVDKGK